MTCKKCGVILKADMDHCPVCNTPVVNGMRSRGSRNEPEVHKLQNSRFLGFFTKIVSNFRRVFHTWSPHRRMVLFRSDAKYKQNYSGVKSLFNTAGYVSPFVRPLPFTYAPKVMLSPKQIIFLNLVLWFSRKWNTLSAISWYPSGVGWTPSFLPEFSLFRIKVPS